MNIKKCPICGSNSASEFQEPAGDSKHIECARCGQYTMSGTLSDIIDTYKKHRHKLCAWIRNYNIERGKPPELDSSNIKKIINETPEYTVNEKLLYFLKYISKKSKYPGEIVPFSIDNDHPVCWASNRQEAKYYIKHAQDRGYLSRNTKNHNAVFRLTVPGWEYLYKNENLIKDTNQCFVAMRFSDEFENVWRKGIKPAITDAGYRPYRIDSEPHIDRIDAKIMTEIKKSKFLVAEVSAHNNGVYFEAGYAFGLNIPVFWVVSQDELKNVHFDTRQYRHVVYKDEESLKNDLHYLIVAVVGEQTSSRDD